jgi:hypothetical protein
MASRFSSILVSDVSAAASLTVSFNMDIHVRAHAQAHVRFPSK